MYFETLPDCRWVKQESRHWKALILFRTVSVWALFSQVMLKGLAFLSEQYPIVHLHIHLFSHLLFTLQLLIFRIHMHCSLLQIVQRSATRKPKRDRRWELQFSGDISALQLNTECLTEGLCGHALPKYKWLPLSGPASPFHQDTFFISCHSEQVNLSANLHKLFVSAIILQF